MEQPQPSTSKPTAVVAPMPLPLPRLEIVTATLEDVVENYTVITETIDITTQLSDSQATLFLSPDTPSPRDEFQDDVIILSGDYDVFINDPYV